jgi:hypothetical protein
MKDSVIILVLSNPVNDAPADVFTDRISEEIVLSNICLVESSTDISDNESGLIIVEEYNKNKLLEEVTGSDIRVDLATNVKYEDVVKVVVGNETNDVSEYVLQRSEMVVGAGGENVGVTVFLATL